MAKAAFIAVWAAVTPTVTVVAYAITEPLYAVVIGLGAGFVTALVTFVLVLIWPAIRLVWYWIGEITALAVVLGVYHLLTGAMPWPAAVGVLLTGGSVLVAVGRSRRFVSRWVWCAISRHRLRTCFATFIRANRHGSLPWILLARPTRAGERVWVWLRPGLSLQDLQTEGGLSRLAVGCWAERVQVSRTKRRNSALIRVDITRRNPLADTVTSPLAHLVPDTTFTGGDQDTTAGRIVPVDMAALDLPGVSEPDEPQTRPSNHRPTTTTATTTGSNGKPVRRNGTTSGSRNGDPAPVATSTGDLAEWI